MTRNLDFTSLQFFSQRWTFVDHVMDFIDSDAGRYLQAVYGELIVKPESNVNFISVYLYIAIR